MPSPPPPPALHLTRRVMDTLSAIHSTPLTFLHAPMGYGKTVAVREYLKAHRATPFWVSVLTSDQNAFWRDFCRVLRKGLAGEPAPVDALEELGYPDDPARTDAVREVLARLDFPPGAVLVLDDVHLLAEAQARSLVRLCLLLARQGASPPLVCISRHLPGPELAEALLKGLAVQVGPAALAFGQEDIRAYFGQCGISLKAQEAAQLFRATGGWVSALYLYQLHYAQHGHLAAPTGISDLLGSQVFDRLQGAARELLLHLAPLESFTLAQAELFRDDARRLLADIVRRNAFISHDPATGSHMLHALFRDFLRERFARLPLERRQETCLRHARWLIGHDEARKAAALLGHVQDSAEALELLESFVDRLPVTEGNGQLLALFRSLDTPVMEGHPGVMFRYAMAALSAGDTQTLAHILARLERHCAALPEDAPGANAWRGELELLLSITRFNDIPAMSAHHRRAEEHFRRSGTGRSRLFGQDPWTLGSPSVLYMYHRKSGALKETVKEMRECLPHYSRLTGMHGAGAEDALLAEARYNAGEFESAAVAAHQALASAREHGQIGIEICARFLLARASMQQGEFDRSLEQMATMRGRVEEEKAFSLLQTLDLCTGLLHVDIRRPERIPGWLLEDGANHFQAFAGGFSHLALGGALLLAGDHAELVGRFSQLLHKGRFGKNLMFAIHANMFIAAGNAGLGLWAEADTALLRALDLALPDRILMPFAVNAVFLPQLKPLGDDTARGRGVRHILKLAARFEKSRSAIVARFFREHAPGLTRREGELVRLALTGMTHKEIAAVLGLAAGSVKRYFAALYKKLGIGNREQLRRYFDERGGPG